MNPFNKIKFQKSLSCSQRADLDKLIADLETEPTKEKVGLLCVYAVSLYSQKYELDEYGKKIAELIMEHQELYL